MSTTTGPSKTPGTTMRVKSAKKANSRAALEKFKFEAASEVGIDLKPGYNGDLTAAQAGSIGGHMVKKMIESFEADIKGDPDRTYTSSTGGTSTTGTTKRKSGTSTTKKSSGKTTSSGTTSGSTGSSGK